MGINEFINIKNDDHEKHVELMLNFSIKYSTLVYLKEELSFIKADNKQFLLKFDDIYHFFLLKASKLFLNLSDEKSKIPHNSILKQVS
jgi:hypothetical protein